MRAGTSSLRHGLLAIATLGGLCSVVGAQENPTLDRMMSDPGLPAENSTSSYWMDNPPFPKIVDIQAGIPKEADIVIIGSGITGAGAAKALLELSNNTASGKPPTIVVLEARKLCSGATGRNGGHIKQAPHMAYGHFTQLFGDDGGRKMLNFELQHLQMLREVGKQVPQGEVREVETVDYFLDEVTLQNAKAGVDNLKTGYPEVKVSVWEGQKARDKFSVNDYVVGAVSYRAGAAWPFRLVTGVWNNLAKKYPNLLINTHTPAQSITTDPKTSASHPYLIKTPKGSIRARHILHATNSYAGHLLPSLRSQITGVRGHMSAQRPGRDFPSTHGRRSWSTFYNPAFDYVTQRPDGPDGSPGDIMAGGGLYRSAGSGLDGYGVWDDSKTEVFTAEHIHGSMPTVHEPHWGMGGGVKKIWTGIMGWTGDLLPLVGAVPTDNSTSPDAPKNKGGLKGSGQWIAAGFSGEGMVRSWLSGTATAIMILGQENERLSRGVGRPAGKLDDWFPTKELSITPERLQKAHVKHLLGLS